MDEDSDSDCGFEIGIANAGKAKKKRLIEQENSFDRGSNGKE